VDVVSRWDQDIEVAGFERSLFDELEYSITARVDLFVLRAAIQPDDAPREVVVDRCLRTRWHDE